MTDQNRVGAEVMEGRQYLIDGRFTQQHAVGNAVDGDAGGLQRTTRVHQLLEVLLLQKPPVQHAQGPNLNDLVAIRGLQTGGLCIENGVDQISQWPIKIDLPQGAIKKIKVIIFRARIAITNIQFHTFLRCGARNQ